MRFDLNGYIIKSVTIEVVLICIYRGWTFKIDRHGTASACKVHLWSGKCILIYVTHAHASHIP